MRVVRLCVCARVHVIAMVLVLEIGLPIALGLVRVLVRGVVLRMH